MVACSGPRGSGMVGVDASSDRVTVDVIDATTMDLPPGQDAAPDVAVDAAAPDATPDVAPDVTPDVTPVDAAQDGAAEASVDAAVDRAVADTPDVIVVADAPDAAVDRPTADAPPTDGSRTFPAGIGMGLPTDPAPEQRVSCGAEPPAPRVTAGAADRLVIRGRVVTPTGVLATGEALVQGGTLACVAASCASRTGYAGATVIETGGIVYPGLVNTHDHPQYDFLPPWTPPTLYPYSDAWQGAAAYRAVTEPLRNNEADHTCAMLKWGELRGIVAGVTSVQGALNRTCATRTLARNLEYGADFGGVDTHRTNTLGIASVASADAATLRRAMDAGEVTAYFLHLAEGVNETAWREWGMLVARNLLAPPLVAIHGTALGRPEFDAMASARARLVWSPRSNLVLYGRTTDVGAALDAGVAVALAPDWTPTGSANLLEELRFARGVSRGALGGRLSARDLVEMATSRAAQVVDRPQVGSLVEGRYADLMVIPDRGCDAYESLVDAPTADVRLVVLGGRVLYGDAAVVDALPAAARARCEPVTFCGQAKRACVALADTANELDRTLAQIEAELRAFSTPFALVPRCPR